MGIIKAAMHAVGGALADQWLEVLEPDEMDDSTVFTRGVTVRRNDKRGQNRKGTADTVSNGSIVHVYPNQFMLLVDGGQGGGFHRRGRLLPGGQFLHALFVQRFVWGRAQGFL